MNTTTVTVIDSIMGSGKTSWALQHMNEASPDQKFIYITPFLDEVERVKKAVSDRPFTEPNNQNAEGRKLRSLKQLIADGYDIASTHSLFAAADDELIELIAEGGYTLILDEVMDVIERANIRQSDIEVLESSGKITVNGYDNRVEWVGGNEYDGRFDDIKMLADAGNLYKFRDQFLLWSFPPAVFKSFDEALVMTYLFDAQIQRYYYDLHGIDYHYKSVAESDGRYVLTEYDRYAEKRKEVMELINLYEGQLNDIGDKPNAFSATRLRNYGPQTIDKIKKNIEAFYRRHTDAKGADAMWTTLMDKKHALKGRGYTKGFVEWNRRATNQYADRFGLAFIYNRYMAPEERAFFEDQDIRVEQDLLAVSDLLQWVWRSRIRNGEPIDLYLPSSRMRNLLKRWATYDI